MAEPEKKDAASNSALSIGNASQIIAIGVAVSYLCGFIEVTSYLGSFGIKEYDALRTQYIVSGVTFLLIVGLYYFFVGRHIPTLDEDTKKYQEMFQRHGASGNFWGFCAFIFSVCELAFFIVVATIIGSSLLFTVAATRTILLAGPMLVGYFLFETVITSKAIESVGKSFWLLQEIFYLTVFIAFYYLADGVIFEFLKAVLIVTGLGFIISNSVHAIGSPKTKKIYLTYLLIFGLVASSSMFGRYFYGQVRASVGGGESEQVRVVIDDMNTPKSLQKELSVSDSISSKINLITQTDSELFLGYPLSEPSQGYKTLIRLDKKLVKAIISNDLTVIKYTKAE